MLPVIVNSCHDRLRIRPRLRLDGLFVAKVPIQCILWHRRLYSLDGSKPSRQGLQVEHLESVGKWMAIVRRTVDIVRPST